MIDEKTLVQVLAEQKEDALGFQSQLWVDRKEEDLFEFESSLA